jgi:hypothetical protein
MQPCVLVQRKFAPMFARHGRNKPASVGNPSAIFAARNLQVRNLLRRLGSRNEPASNCQEPAPRYAEVLGLRRESQFNDRQVLPTIIITHIKANESCGSRK